MRLVRSFVILLLIAVAFPVFIQLVYLWVSAMADLLRAFGWSP